MELKTLSQMDRRGTRSFEEAFPRRAWEREEYLTGMMLKTPFFVCIEDYATIAADFLRLHSSHSAHVRPIRRGSYSPCNSGSNSRRYYGGLQTPWRAGC